MTKGFQDELAFCSNFYEHEFWLPTLNVYVPTAEHAYQMLKTNVKSEQEWILEASTPGQAKKRGFRSTLRPGWNEGLRLWAMIQVVSSKFKELELQERLYDTTEHLINWNTWNDDYWGICTCPKHAGSGKNMLGELLMMRRSLKDSL